MSGHRHAAFVSRDSRPLSHWIRKHGRYSFEPIILAEAELWDDLCQLEVEFIAKMRTHKSQGGLNVTWGGDGHLGHAPTPETIEKIRRANIGREHSAESIDRMRASLIRWHAENPVTSETRARMGASARARMSDPGVRRAMSLAARKVSDNDEAIVRRMTAWGFTQQAIADRVGVTQGGVALIQKRLGIDPRGSLDRASSERNRASIPDRTVRYARALVNDLGATINHASVLAGINRSAVHRIASGQRYTMVV